MAKSKKNNLPRLVLYFDGACWPKNPGGNVGCGWYVTEKGFPKDRMFEGSHFIPESPLNSNNVAEYIAMRMGLEDIIARGYGEHPISVVGDSMLVIEQMDGEWGIGNGLYREHALKALDVVKKFSDITFRHISRDQNAGADELSRSAFNALQKDMQV